MTAKAPMPVRTLNLVAPLPHEGTAMRITDTAATPMQGRSGAVSQQWTTLCALYGNRCACCGSPERLTPDHIIALARGGSNRIANIQPLCLDCNRRKWVRPVVYGFQPYYNPAAMLSDPEAWLRGDADFPVVYQNGAVQPLLFSAEEGS